MRECQEAMGLISKTIASYVTWSKFLQNGAMLFERKMMPLTNLAGSATVRFKEFS